MTMATALAAVAAAIACLFPAFVIREAIRDMRSNRKIREAIRDMRSNRKSR